RFLSVEPQYGPLALEEWLPRLDWVIQGGESGRNAQAFDLAWARELRDLCRRHEVRYFLKQLGSHVVQNGARLPFDDSHAGNWSEWPEDLRVREVPEMANTESTGQEATPTKKKKTPAELSAIARRAVETRRRNASAEAGSVQGAKVPATVVPSVDLERL